MAISTRARVMQHAANRYVVQCWVMWRVRDRCVVKWPCLVVLVMLHTIPSFRLSAPLL